MEGRSNNLLERQKLNNNIIIKILVTGWQVQKKSYLKMKYLPEIPAAYSVSTLKNGTFVKWTTVKKIQQCGSWHISL